jgi:hypothetical protein
MDLNVHVITEGNHNLLNLLGQLTSGCQNERLALAELGIKIGKSANSKSGGLSLFGREITKEEENMSTTACAKWTNRSKEAILWRQSSKKVRF